MSDGLEERFQDALTSLIDGRAADSEDTRATALNSLADLILETARTGSRHLPIQFNELMMALLPRVGPRVRENIARRIAACGLINPDIARLLAADSPEIAAPVLRLSPALTEADLLDIATGDNDEKARSIAARATLGADIVAALIDRHDPVVGAALVQSQGAALDEATAERIALIANLPRGAARRLIDIAALSDAALAQLFWQVDGDARRQIVDRIAARRPEGDIPSPDGAGQLGDALFALAAARDRGEIAARLAEALSMSRFLAARIVGDAQGEALVIAARAAGVSPERVTGIVLLTVAEAGQSYDTLRTLVGLADDIAHGTAKHIASLWARGTSADRRPRHEAAVARPAARAARGAAATPRRLEDVVADISRRSAS